MALKYILFVMAFTLKWFVYDLCCHDSNLKIQNGLQKWFFCILSLQQFEHWSDLLMYAVMATTWTLKWFIYFAMATIWTELYFVCCYGSYLDIEWTLHSLILFHSDFSSKVSGNAKSPVIELRDTSPKGLL